MTFNYGYDPETFNIEIQLRDNNWYPLKCPFVKGEKCNLLCGRGTHKDKVEYKEEGHIRRSIFINCDGREIEVS